MLDPAIYYCYDGTRTYTLPEVLVTGLLIGPKAHTAGGLSYSVGNVLWPVDSLLRLSIYVEE